MVGSTAPETFDHERVVVSRGRRSGLVIAAAVHSTALGSAVGGTRMWTYPSWQDALADALRLSSAMSLKAAAAGLRHGGGKAVIALRPDTVLDDDVRAAAMRDLGDVVESLGGDLRVGEDVGTTSADMLVVREHTNWVGGLPTEMGGSGEPAEATAVGVFAAIDATVEHAFGRADVAGLKFCVVGLGQVGERLCRGLARGGARLTVTDLDPRKRHIAEELGARWVDAGEALDQPVDVLVPAALGGILTTESVERLRCRAVVGPANNQLAADSVASLLAARGVLWAPDFIVNAGGVIHAVEVGIDGSSWDEAIADVGAIRDRLASVYSRADRLSVAPLQIALEDARERLLTASATVGSHTYSSETTS
jgi:leucine dehydrogenase